MAISALLLTAVWALLGLVAAALTVLTGYLVVLTVAALFACRHAPSAGPTRRRFAVLVPAHNEAALIERLIASLQQLDYPADLFDVCVVADNCTDATASIARSMRVRVYERFDEVHKAKGFALRWLLTQLDQEHQTYDAFVVFDADSVVAANFLRSMDARLEAGSQVIQAYYSVQNAGQSKVAGLRFAALAGVHYVRPLGRSAFGFSCGLKGNGMCFAARIIERFGWDWFTLAEDVEFHIALVKAGIRVDFAPETTVHADMPTSFSHAASQNERWERGRLQLAQRQVFGLMKDGVRTASLMHLDAAVEQLIPPLSVPFAASAVCLLASYVLGFADLALIFLLSLVALGGHLIIGLILVRAPLSTYVAFTAAPIYVAWKVSMYARALVSNQATEWVRTIRPAPQPVPPA